MFVFYDLRYMWENEYETDYDWRTQKVLLLFRIILHLVTKLSWSLPIKIPQLNLE